MMKNPKIKYGLPFQILVALIIGLMVGPLLGNHALFWGEVSKHLIRLIKVIAIPLLFFAIWDAVLKAEIGAKSAFRMGSIAVFNATIALTIGLVLSNWLTPGSGFVRPHQSVSASDVKKLEAFAGKKIELGSFISELIPANILQAFLDQNVITLVLTALLLGWASRMLEKEKHISFHGFTSGGMLLFEYAMRFPIRLLPLAVFGSVARTVGEYGYSPFLGLAKYVGVGLLGLTLHVLIVYQSWIRFYAKMSLKFFWQYARIPVVYALGSNSSLATLPVTLDTLENKLGVSPGSARLGACVGTNLNNDGIILYEAMAVLFVAQAYGIHLTFEQQLLASFSCMIAAMGIAGVPEAGVISLALVLNTVGLPTELLPILLSVDWILARSRSATNVLSDMVVSIVLDKNKSTPQNS